jgi:hypothetical protein
VREKGYIRAEWASRITSHNTDWQRITSGADPTTVLAVDVLWPAKRPYHNKRRQATTATAIPTSMIRADEEASPPPSPPADSPLRCRRDECQQQQQQQGPYSPGSAAVLERLLLSNFLTGCASSFATFSAPWLLPASASADSNSPDAKSGGDNVDNDNDPLDAVVTVPAFLQPILGIESLPHHFCGGNTHDDEEEECRRSSSSSSSSSSTADLNAAALACDAARHGSRPAAAAEGGPDHLGPVTSTRPKAEHYDSDVAIPSTRAALPGPARSVSSTPGDAREAKAREGRPALFGSTTTKKWRSAFRIGSAATVDSPLVPSPSSESSSHTTKDRPRHQPHRPLATLRFASPSFQSPNRPSSFRKARRRRTHSEEKVSSLQQQQQQQQQQQHPKSMDQLDSIHCRIKDAHERTKLFEKDVAKSHAHVESLQQALQSARATWEEQSRALAEANQELAQLREQARALRAAALDVSCDPPPLLAAATSSADLSAPADSSRGRSFTADDAALCHRRRGKLEKCHSDAAIRTNTSTLEACTDTRHPTSNDGAPAAVRHRASTDSKVLRATSLASFMRVSDLGVPRSPPASSDTGHHGDGNGNDDTTSWTTDEDNNNLNSSPDFYWLDENLPMVLDRLWRLGWDVVTDESDRFQYVGTGSSNGRLGPHNCSVLQSESNASNIGWPVHPWHQPVGDDNNVLLWVGSVLEGDRQHHGHDWPIVKARGLVRATPRHVADLLLDSSQVHVYNKMSAERRDVTTIQGRLDTTEEDSVFGIAGVAKITRSVMKPRLLPKPIETVSLWHAKPLPFSSSSSSPDIGYMIVTRSVWDDAPTTPTNSTSSSKSPSSIMHRSEMLLGVHLCRPVRVGADDAACCELTTVTHVYPSGVPEYLAKRMAPSTAASSLACIQSHFSASSNKAS